MNEKIKKPLKKSNLNFVYFFDKSNKESKCLADFIKNKLIQINYYNYINFDFINIGLSTFKLDKFCESKKFKKANIIFIEKKIINLIGEQNLTNKEVNILDKESFEVAEKLAETYNNFYYDVFDKIGEYINNYYGKIKCFQIANRNTCEISITEDVEATYIMQMENRYFTKYNKDDFEDVCKNAIKRSISMEELNVKRLEIALKDSQKKLEVLNNRLDKIGPEIRGL